MQNVPLQTLSAKRRIESSTTKPEALPVNSNGIPAELKQRDQWVCWKYVWRVDKKGKGNWTKIPVDPRTGDNASCDEPTTWGCFEDAVSRYQTDHLDGIGYEFSEDDPFCGTDLDDCRDPDTGEITEWGNRLIAKLDTYTEISPSRTGAKAIVKARKPGARCSKKYKTGKVEIYDKERFFALTGHPLDGTPATVHDRQGQIEEVYFEVFGEPSTPQAASGQPEANAAADLFAATVEQPLIPPTPLPTASA